MLRLFKIATFSIAGGIGTYASIKSQTIQNIFAQEKQNNNVTTVIDPTITKVDEKKMVEFQQTKIGHKQQSTLTTKDVKIDLNFDKITYPSPEILQLVQVQLLHR